MPFYRNHVYPRLIATLGNPRPIREIRRRIVPLARGTVLEIGVGPGPNFVYYDPARVSKVYALEPNPVMIRLAGRERRRTKLDVEFLDLPGERIPLDGGVIDTVVSTFTLCTIPGVVEAIRGIARVLRPGGMFLFAELALSPDARVRRWQERWDPVLCRLFEGLRVTRDIPSLIAQGGFTIERIDTAYLAPFPKSWACCAWGIAVPQPG
jgi:SAM-dependent methyltransferase